MLNGLLLPFFFASIGFAILLAQLLHDRTVWHGIIFAGLMGFAKFAAGGWVVLADWIERRREGKVQGGQEVAISEAEGGRRLSEAPVMTGSS
ncbi:unnamed protein product [Tilletia controversa]|uniref:Major facilitator superfamily (MFS) profile domain-containing protein n=1 Tax=Tilletia caries TaxID=13290 RepID=A0ABN7IR78_9BASI|nr:unnamed protein product [Tilletia controversa]CAD6919852.1 unnamed protein product [Tilletia caries]CAD6904373.1 unnamed protein product [Tilletia controversa]CAD6916322.1 unnamed protein product [Tilletia controversa]CAD6926024.1 unnamed protein product [Tilletia caries]